MPLNISGGRNFPLVSSLNSSTTPLGIGSSFIGTIEQTTGYAVISLFVHSDKSSATNGLIIEYSSDGINFDSDDMFTFSPTGTKLFTFGVVSKYFRVRYINGSQAQTEFRLQTILHPQNIKPSTHRIGSSISQENDAELTLSVLAGRDLVDGTFKNVGVSSSRLLVSQEISSIPVGSTAVGRTTDGLVSTFVDDVYTITNTKTLTIQRLFGGAQGSISGGKVELFYDPLATGIGMTLIAKFFLNGSSSQIDLSDKFVGDGIRAIRMRRTGLSGGSQEMFSRWIGYEE